MNNKNISKNPGEKYYQNWRNFKVTFNELLRIFILQNKFHTTAKKEEVGKRSPKQIGNLSNFILKPG